MQEQTNQPYKSLLSTEELMHLHMHLPSCLNKSQRPWDCGGKRRMVTYVEVADNGQLIQIWEENKIEQEE